MLGNGSARVLNRQLKDVVFHLVVGPDLELEFGAHTTPAIRPSTVAYLLHSVVFLDHSLMLAGGEGQQGQDNM